MTLSSPSQQNAELIKFFDLILPVTGHRVLQLKRGDTFLKPQFYATNPELAEAALREDARGLTVYHAVASFREALPNPPKGQPRHGELGRCGPNVHRLKALCFEIDIHPSGVKKGRPCYRNTNEAAEAIVKFCRTVDLPLPLVVASSLVPDETPQASGLHCYLPLDQELTSEERRPYAAGLQALCERHGLLVDPARTCDVSSILRPPGSTNRKSDRTGRVQIIKEAGAYALRTFTALQAAGRGAPPARAKAPAFPSLPVPPGGLTHLANPDRRHVSSDVAMPEEYAPADPHLIAEKCGQLGELRDKRGNIPYPQWSRGVWLLAFCENGDAVAHEWSNGHAGYTHAETQKLLDHGRTLTGPITCEEFHKQNAAVCKQCPFWEKIKNPTGVLEQVDAATPSDVTLDDFYAYLPTHEYIFVPTRALWPAASVNAKLLPVQQANGKKLAPNSWLDRNRSIAQMTWMPGMPMLIQDRLVDSGGWIEHKGANTFNLYRPPAIIPGNATAVAPWLDHAYRIFGAEVELLLDWFAHRVQRPGEKPNFAPVLISYQGGGKDTLLEPVVRAVGPWNAAEVSPQQVMGRFNSHVKSVILRVSEARDLGEVNRYAFNEKMKTLIATPPITLRCDEKHRREYYVFNCTGVIFTSNHRIDCLYLTPDDRRHYVLRSPLKEEDFPAGYFDALWRWYEREGGFDHVAAFLAERDIAKFNSKAPPPKTQAFWDIVDAGRAPESPEVADAIDALGNMPALTLDLILSKSPGLSAWLRDVGNRRLIPHRMESAGCVPVRNSAAQDGLWKINGRRQVIYARAELPLQAQLAAAHKLVNELDGKQVYRIVKP